MKVVSDVLSQLGLSNIALIILLLSLFIDLSPIKINPIKTVLGWFGRYLNKSIQVEISGFKEEVNSKLSEIQKEQDSQRATLNKIVYDREAREVSRLKWEVIEFETMIRNGQKHGRDQYRHILDSAQKFERMSQDTECLIKIPQTDILAVKESENFIRTHYDQHRSTQDLYF